MTTVKWKLLSEKRPSYNPKRISEMRLLYAGGYDVQDHAGLFLAQLNQESPQAFAERKRMSAYRPYLGKFVNIYSANLHSTEIYVHPDTGAKDDNTVGDVPLDNEFYKLFASNCDRRGTDFNQFMKCHATKRALIEEYSFIRADFPKAEYTPTNLLEEELSGNDRAYITEVDCLSVWNYKIDPATGLFEWVVLGNQICVKPRFNDIPMYHYLVEVLSVLDGVCVSEFYQTESNADPEFVPLEAADIPLVETVPTSFREVPIYITDLSSAMSLGFKLGPLAVEHYNMQSYETSATAKACVTIPVLKLGPNVPAPGGAINLTQMKSKRGDDPKGQFNKKGYMTIGSEDTLEIVEAAGTALKFIHLQNEDRVEGMHEMANQLHSSSKQTSSKTGRSAQAMRESRFQMEISLVDYRTEIYRVAKNIYRGIATARGESIVWVPGGLCVEPPEDREILLKEAVALSAYKIGSTRFDKKYRFRLANSLIGNQSREEQEDMMLEIDATVDRESAAELYGPKFDATLQQEINATLKVDEPGVYPAASTVAEIGAKNAAAAPKTDAAPTVGDSGQEKLDSGSHLQTPGNVNWQTVYDLLLKDYKASDLGWVKLVPWRGPLEIELSDISFAGQDNWSASQPGAEGQDKVAEFADLLQDKGFAALKPVILANMPHNNEQYTIIDGRHRVLAAQQAGIPVLAYIADVGSMDSDTPHMQLHGKQVGSNNSSGS